LPSFIRGTLRSSLLALLCVSCLDAGAKLPAPVPETPSECFERIVTVLADDAMEGRGVGTEGLENAARYLEAEFRSLGLQDGGVGYRQTFQAETGVTLGENNALSWSGPDGEGGAAAELGKGFVPLGFSSSREFSGAAVFVGYGIRAEALGYDDYAGVDAEGKVLLAMRYEPGEKDENSPFDGKRPSAWSDLRYKALMAREAGAAALLFVSPPEEGDGEPDRLPILKNEVLLSRAGLPVLQVTPAVADRWLAATGSDLLGLRRAIDADYTPRSFPIASLQVRGRADVLTKEAPVRNIVGVLPGRGVLAEEAVVVGAHYDHLGFGGFGSLEPDVQAVHNGADDNASGVAAMLCAVRDLRRRVGASSADRRTLVVAAFVAEEIGLGGSAHYVQNPVHPLERTVAMVNLDMVGRLREGKLTSMGSDSATEWDALLRGVASRFDLELSTGGDGYGPSDQMPFYQKEIPVVHLFTGAHSDYHTPSDDVVALNLEGGGRVAGFVDALLGDLLKGRERLSYQVASGTASMAGDSRSYGAYLGSIPDYSGVGDREGGVLLSGVRKGGPADRADLRAGDTIVEMAGVEIRNIYDLTFVLREHRPGETVELTVLREDERVSLLATLGRRGDAPSAGVHEAEPADVWTPGAGKDASHLLDERETHLADLRQLTFDGENAEAYFSPDGRSLVFQRTPAEGGCDQQYLLDLDSGDVERLSSGKGRTTCGYYAYPDGERLIYATTEQVDAVCPAEPDRSQGYVWGLHDFDLVWQRGPGAATEPFVSVPGSTSTA
jgi:hypothetical protein